MQANGARLEFDATLWVQWHHTHAWVESGRVLAEPLNGGAVVSVYDAWGRVLGRYGFRHGEWRHVDTGAAPESLDEGMAGRVAPAHALLPHPGLALAAQVFRARRPIHTPAAPGVPLPREDSAIVQGLIRGAIALVLAGWLVVWLAWVAYLVWKVWVRVQTGLWPMLTLHDVGVDYHVGWPAAQYGIDYVLHLGLGWTFLLAGTAIYVLLGGTVLFFVFMVIKLAETMVRTLYASATAGIGNRMQ
jgi:hypothetical protein